MVNISASQVSELRKKTDCGFMDCKRALMEAGGDLDKAVDILRKKGIAKAAKKAERIASDGLIAIKCTDDKKYAVMIEINCETDFVARDTNFREFVDKVGNCALSSRISEISVLEAAKLSDGKTISETKQELIAKLGENITLRRIAVVQTTGIIGHYLHGTKIGVLVALSNANVGLAKDLAMHIAASRPKYVLPEQVSADLLENEREIFKAQSAQSGKPAAVIEKMVAGRLKKYINEITLVGQPFVKYPEQTVGQLLAAEKATVDKFIRFELGEGIEKKVVDFAEEVKQVAGEK